MTVGEKIKAARKAAGLTQDKLAELSHISQHSIAMYEVKPGIKIRRSNLIKLSKVLDVTVDYLSDDNESDPQKGAEIAPYIDQVREACGDEEAKDFADMLQKQNQLFAGGTLNDEAREGYYRAMANAYVHINERAAKKYGRKRKIYK